jgi:hypothetical protein
LKARWLCWAHEALFSLNLAWILIWRERMRSSARLYALPIVRYLYTHIRFVEPQTVIEQVCWSLVVGVSIFLLLRLLSQFWLIGALMRTVAGAVALAGFPIFAVAFPFAFFNALRIEAYGPLVLVETLVVLVCGILYYLRKWPFPAGLGVALLFLHFGLLAWVSGCWVSPLQEVRVYGIGSVGIWISTAFYFGFPLLGFFSSLTGAHYVRSRTGRLT